MKTLLLFDMAAKQAFAMLGDYAGFYGYNGGRFRGNSSWNRVPKPLDKVAVSLFLAVG